MPRRRSPVLASRKQPRQARSAQRVADILAAAIRVLRRDGGPRFTTIRVAAAAGISVGSLYQYFPNKVALLFRLQADEWADTLAMLGALLADPTTAPVTRLRSAIHAFFRSEAAEADLRRALADVSALFRDAPEMRAQQAAGQVHAQAFFREALPRRAPADIAFLADFFTLTLSAIAEKVSDRTLTPRQLARFTSETSDLLCSHLVRLAR